MKKLSNENYDVGRRGTGELVSRLEERPVADKSFATGPFEVGTTPSSGSDIHASEGTAMEKSSNSDIGTKGTSSLNSTAPTPEVLYSRHGVHVKPSPAESIPGNLNLVKFSFDQEEGDSSTFIAWFPEVQSDNIQAGKRSKYALHPLAITDIKAIRAWNPPFRTHRVTLILHSGESIPSFYFQNGGVKALLTALQDVITLVPSKVDPWTFTLHHTNDDLWKLGMMSIHADRQRNEMLSSQLHELEMSKKKATEPTLSNTTLQHKAIDGKQIINQIHDFMNAFHKFSYDARESMTSFLSASSIVPEVSLSDGGLGFVFQGRLSDDVNAENDTSTQTECKETIESVVRKTENEPLSPSLSASGWEMVERSASSSHWVTSPRRAPVGEDELSSMMDTHGRLVNLEIMKKRVFYGGATLETRYKVWKYLLGIELPDMTSADRHTRMEERKLLYLSLRNQWQSISRLQASKFSKWRERKSRVEKDVRRTDRAHEFFALENGQGVESLKDILLTHIMWNFDLGYCQGMSDLASPILLVVRWGMFPRAEYIPQEEDWTLVESEAFWMFASLMEKLEPNFTGDCMWVS